jgi:hypothetical protein
LKQLIFLILLSLFAFIRGANLFSIDAAKTRDWKRSRRENVIRMAGLPEGSSRRSETPLWHNFHRRLAGIKGFALDSVNSGGLLVLAKHRSGHKRQRAGGRFL